MLSDRQPRSFLDAQVLSRLSGIPLFARRPMQGNVSGRHASPHRGSSVEFAEYRKYVPGDDLRRLDWRAYGRSDRFYVKEFEADTNLRCCFVLDTSGSMNFGSTGVTKIEYARRIAGTLSYLASQQGDAVGLACVADGVTQNLPPKRNAAHLRLVLDQLEQAKPKGDTQLAAVLHELAETIRQRALIIILSDLFIEPALLQSCFQHLRFRHHDAAVFHLLDPLELNFQFRRPMRFLDMEGGPAIFAEPNDIADRYDKALQLYLKDLKQVVLESAIDYHRISIDEDYEQVLVRFLVSRAQVKGMR
ncbi:MULTISPECIES: DUF58 domain-containing protein [unclassified Schlesneria]|uniref:DUF58 domain-containing protein n=1 Tax=Schlesneria TaxID=656899 RepID=UPI0035A16D24